MRESLIERLFQDKHICRLIEMYVSYYRLRVATRSSKTTTEAPIPPGTLDEMRLRLAAEQHLLSPRLQDVGAYVAAHPQSIAVDTLAEIAERAGSHPSTLVRFANHFGFGGFSELQGLYKQHVHEHFAAVDYGARIRSLQQQPGECDAVTSAGLLDEFTDASLLSLQRLRAETAPEDLDGAVDLLDDASRIFVCGIRRAFPVAMYASYALTHVGTDCRTIDGLGMMHGSQTRTMTADDLLLAITYRPYANEVQEAIAAAHAVGARVILITDSKQSPGAEQADIVFAAPDAEVRSFRSLNASLCLTQTLCISLGYRRDASSASADAKSAN